MSRKPNSYNAVIKILQELHSLYPTYNMGRHLSTALSDYGDVWGMTDKELLFALEKYKSQLEMDVQHVDEAEIEQIMKDGMNLDEILKDEDYGEEY